MLMFEMHFHRGGLSLSNTHSVLVDLGISFKIERQKIGAED